MATGSQVARFISQTLIASGMTSKSLISISGEGTEVDVSWSCDPEEAIWLSGVPDLSILEPKVADGIDHWSRQGSTLFVEDAASEQSLALALIPKRRCYASGVCPPG